MLRRLSLDILSCLALLVFSIQTCGAQVDDVRIIIDISGSMVKTDPNNLRQPAMRMLSGLIPRDAYAGVWTFGRYTNMEVKWGKVDDKWRERAVQGASAIHSRGQFTNIEGAIKRASVGWDKPDPDTRRNLILLTDGKIDVAKDYKKNQASREALLSKTIPQLIKNGVTIHTIALSQFTDEVLLKRMAFETGGSFEIASTAERLQRVFLKMFERATLPDMVPLSDNRFTIDQSVQEMTLLVFNKSGNTTTLTTPEQVSYTQQKHDSQVSWVKDEGYDLITVTQPQSGEWILGADVDPDNRVMIVTDLKLEVDEIPAYLTPGNEINLKVELHNKGEKISKNSFLKFVDFYLMHQVADQQKKIPLELKKSREVADKGIYLQTLSPPLTEGLHEIEVHADGSTFKRSKKFAVKAYWPVAVNINETNRPGVYVADLMPQIEYIKPESVQIQLEVERPDGVIQRLQAEKFGEGWSAEVAITQQDGPHKLLVTIQAQTHDGLDHQYELPPYPLVGFKHSSAEDAEDSSEVQNDAGLAEPVMGDHLEEAGSDLLFNVMVIALVNVGMIIVGLGIFWYLKRSKARDVVKVIEPDENGRTADDEVLLDD